MTGYDELLRRKREARLRIARSRLRIDRRLRTVEGYVRTGLSWRTRVVRHPAWALASAAGVGLAAVAGFKPTWISRWLRIAMVRYKRYARKRRRDSRS
jgi:hypothetical protein